MKCDCGGTMTIWTIARWNDDKQEWEQIRVWVCGSCGHQED